MKDDLAGGKLPSADFGENAAWWWIMILAFNLNAMMKKLALGAQLAAKADEGGAVFFDQPSGSGRKTFTASDHPINKKSSVVRVIG